MPSSGILLVAILTSGTLLTVLSLRVILMTAVLPTSSEILLAAISQS